MSKTGFRPFAFLAAIAALALADAALVAQDLHPSRRPSPMGLARTHIGDAYVFVVYSRPYKRGRDNIFGSEESEALVPYGKVWRTGANEATQFTTTAHLEIGGQTLPAGTYSLFTTPGESEWAVHFNDQLGLSGTGIFADGEFTPVDLTENVLDVTVASSSLAEEDEVDQFTISFEETEDGSEMVLHWITTEIRVPVKLAG